MHILAFLCVYQENTTAKIYEEKHFLSDNNALIIEHDYAEVLKAELDMEIQTKSFGFNCTL